jgi:hypothetical protein
MSIIEKQTTLGRSIYEINTNTIKDLATLSRENIEKYFDTSRTFGEKLPEVKDISTFVTLQREYGENIWSNVKEAVSAHNGIVRQAFEDTRTAFEEAYTTQETESKPAKPAPKAKAKAKVKAETSAAA